MPDYSRTTVFILTPLIFHFHLPLRVKQIHSNEGTGPYVYELVHPSKGYRILIFKKLEEDPLPSVLFQGFAPADDCLARWTAWQQFLHSSTFFSAQVSPSNYVTCRKQMIRLETAGTCNRKLICLVAMLWTFNRQFNCLFSTVNRRNLFKHEILRKYGEIRNKINRTGIWNVICPTIMLSAKYNQFRTCNGQPLGIFSSCYKIYIKFVTSFTKQQSQKCSALLIYFNIY